MKNWGTLDTKSPWQFVEREVTIWIGREIDRKYDFLEKMKFKGTRYLEIVLLSFP